MSLHVGHCASQPAGRPARAATLALIIDVAALGLEWPVEERQRRPEACFVGSVRGKYSWSTGKDLLMSVVVGYVLREPLVPKVDSGRNHDNGGSRLLRRCHGVGTQRHWLFQGQHHLT